MPKQKGAQKQQGTSGDVTHYKSQDGYMIREKGGVAKSRIKNDDAYKRTRENMSEFSEAAKAGKLIRMVFRSWLKNVADSRLTSRLQQVLATVLKTDLTSDRGQRKVVNGELIALQGFDFNARSTITGTLYAPYAATLDRATGQATVEVPAFVPEKMVAAPQPATHFRIVSAAAEIDFVNNTFVVNGQSTADIALNIATTEAITLQSTLTANSQLPLFLAVGIEFYQQVNGKMYLLNSGDFNAFSLIKVEKVITTP